MRTTAVQSDATLNKPTFYIGRRDTRWDVYPSAEPTQVFAVDVHGAIWFPREHGGWFRSFATAMHRGKAITAEDVQRYRDRGDWHRLDNGVVIGLYASCRYNRWQDVKDGAPNVQHGEECPEHGPCLLDGRPR